MCGIVGFYESSTAGDGGPAIVRSMLARIRHRGPDGDGVFCDHRVGLGAVRLAVLDPEAGGQPMVDAEERHVLVYNGELYNYVELRQELEARGRRFSTRGDTEVVLQALIHWGPQVLARFNGPFALALYDRREGTLLLARDRWGKRPLYYAEHEGGLLFCSELKALLGFPGFAFAFDPAQLASILTVWTPLPHQTGFRGVHQLPVGEFMRLGPHGRGSGRHASLDCGTRPFDGAGVRTLLAESVRLRLRSDVEVGVYLSGGLDSAIITSLAPAGVRTFSVEFEDAAYDESAEQGLLARHFGTRHTAIRVHHRDIAAHFPAALYHAEVPVFRSAFVPMFLLSRAVRDAGLKVVLTGEGADETFLGYDIFREASLRSDWHALDVAERRRRLGSLYRYLAHFREENLSSLMAVCARQAHEERRGLFSHQMRFQNGKFASRLLAEPTDGLAALERMLDDDFHALPMLARAQWLEFKTLLAGYLLSTQGDRMCMAHGVENRCPFLDPSLLPLAVATNPAHEDKSLLRKAFAADLPPQVANSAKRPYRAPDSAAFLAARPPYLELLLSDRELSRLDFLDLRFCRSLVDKLTRQPQAASAREDQAFMFLLSLALLAHQFVDAPVAPAMEALHV